MFRGRWIGRRGTVEWPARSPDLALLDLYLWGKLKDNTLLAIDSVPPHGIVQPPPYISPPKPEECQKEKVQDILKDPAIPQKIQSQCDNNQQNYERQTAQSHPKVYGHNPRWNLCDSNKLSEQNNISSCNDFQHACDQHQIVHIRNARNQQYYVPEKDVNQHFYTLPSRRPQRDVEPPRSVTPDITRGLGRGSLSTMHILARHGQKTIIDQDSNRYGSQIGLNRRKSESFEAENRLVQNQQQSPIVDIRNRFATPLGLTALGYRFFASSPVRDPVTKSPSADALKHNPISPIGHSYGNSFKPSTPTGRSMPTVAERLALTANNCPSPMPNSKRSSPVQSSSGRSTPTNLILSPTKSTMSNEELFAAIHKSKKRLNIKDDNENQSPYGSTNSLVKVPTDNRHSWSSEPQKSSMITQNVPPSPPATSRLDFKRLLLQQSVKSGPTKLSAAEQLKLSRQQCQQQQLSPNVQQTTPLVKVLSPRSVWRFQTPRTDVLSSTIIEDAAAEEKAMKPSPENTSPISRLNTRRQLDLCSNFPENIVDSENEASDAYNDRLLLDNAATSDIKAIMEIEFSGRNVQTEEMFADKTDASAPNTSPSGLCVSEKHSQNNVKSSSTIPYPSNSSQLTASCQQAISAFESRRISNQLARAQFLASTPTTVNQGRSTYARKIFRARSESPQNSAIQNVSRSPSVPTLETAL
ncbi:hypothetical protein WH47_02442 [Habropoda laboriosa]|uniref:Uncharacterized protein n=1 Tax=Habropoda laboriosa TaxID=597456 RepID=A0A0L7QWJ0_9HYME|nr:hypothetical protein WH47_02442 [Habropoda laboriosa]